MTSLLLTTDPAPPDALLSRGLNSDLATNPVFVLFLLFSVFSGCTCSFCQQEAPLSP